MLDVRCNVYQTNATQYLVTLLENLVTGRLDLLFHYCDVLSREVVDNVDCGVN